MPDQPMPLSPQQPARIPARLSHDRQPLRAQLDRNQPWPPPASSWRGRVSEHCPVKQLIGGTILIPDHPRRRELHGTKTTRLHRLSLERGLLTARRACGSMARPHLPKANQEITKRKVSGRALFVTLGEVSRL